LVRAVYTLLCFPLQNSIIVTRLFPQLTKPLLSRQINEGQTKAGSSKWLANHLPDHYYNPSVDTGISASISAAV
jgi:hypothetical protein